MLIKTVGAVLVLTSATAIGSLFAMQVKEQERWLKDIKMALFLLMGELEYHQRPLPEALKQTGKRHEGRMKEFFISTAEELERKEGKRLGAIWRYQAERVLKKAPLNAEQKKEFSEIGSYFAEADSKVRKNAVEFYFSRLEEEIVQIRETGKDKAYLYRMMGMLGGIFLLLLVA